MIREKPHKRKTWAPHAIEGWYIGPAMEHFRCYKVFTTSTQAERITDTVKFTHHELSTPQTLQQAMPSTIEAIENSKPILQNNTTAKKLTSTHEVQRV